MIAVRDVSAMISRGVCLGLPVALAVVGRAYASDFPSRQVTLTVPYAAGTADIVARLIA